MDESLEVSLSPTAGRPVEQVLGDQKASDVIVLEGNLDHMARVEVTTGASSTQPPDKSPSLPAGVSVQDIPGEHTVSLHTHHSKQSQSISTWAGNRLVNITAKGTAEDGSRISLETSTLEVTIAPLTELVHHFIEVVVTHYIFVLLQ